MNNSEPPWPQCNGKKVAKGGMERVSCGKFRGDDDAVDYDDG